MMDWVIDSKPLDKSGFRLLAAWPGRTWRELSERLISDDPMWAHGARLIPVSELPPIWGADVWRGGLILWENRPASEGGK